MNMRPGGFPPFNGNMNRPPFQMGGMARSPINGFGGMGRPQMNMFNGRLNQNPLQAIGRMSRLGARMPNGGTGGMNSGGGLISRLFQRAGGGTGNIANATAGFQRAAGGGGGGLLRGLTNPGSIGTFLNNTQNVLRTAQQIGPMVQQYGPFIKNIPGMIKMYRSLKSTDSDDTTEENNEEKSTSKISNTTKRNTSKRNTSNSNRRSSSKQDESIQIDHEDDTEKITTTSSVHYQKGASKPKLYI